MVMGAGGYGGGESRVNGTGPARREITRSSKAGGRFVVFCQKETSVLRIMNMLYDYSPDTA